ncbi:hypothetical protein HYT25_00035 [Candidatus Pacearchaeota archaeon]|nr:hypothetical protein [Candidatus Pacearchaeota archaeon]
MKKRLVIISVAVIFIVVLFSVLFFFNNLSFSKEFTTDKILIKSVIKENEILNRTLLIQNHRENDFMTEITDLENLTFLSEKNFHLDSNEAKEIMITFTGENSNPGVYAGSLIIKSGKTTETIPIILEIQSLSQYFAMSTDVDSKYKDIKKGEDLVVGVNFFNLKNTETKSVDVEYKIINSNGEEIFSEKENLALGSKTTITKTIQTPNNVKTENYVFAAVLNYQNSTSTTSYFFTISNKISLADLLDENFFLVAILVVLFLIVGIIIYILMERDKLLLKLREQQKHQLKFYTEGIEKQKQNLLKKARTENEKEKIKREYSDARSRVLREIKNEQRNQRKELRKLSSKKQNREVGRKIRKWRKETYAKALEKAEINQELKAKLLTLKRAYSEGYISREAYKKGESRINRFTKK